MTPEEFKKHWARLQRRWADVQAHLVTKQPDPEFQSLIAACQARMAEMMADWESVPEVEAAAVYRALGRVLKVLGG